MDQDKEQNVKSGQQGSKEPWKKPEKSDHHPTKDSVTPVRAVPRTTRRRDMGGVVT
jgi:hypothetical protein